MLLEFNPELKGMSNPAIFKTDVSGDRLPGDDLELIRPGPFQTGFFEILTE